MNRGFTWKGLKLGLMGVALGGLSLAISTPNIYLNYCANGMMVIGIALVFIGAFLHNKDIFENKGK